MATFRFELDHKPTRNKTYNLYLMVTVGKKRTKKKTGIQVKSIDDFNQMRKTLYAAISAKNALINKYLKFIADKAEITKNLSFHISRHSFAKVAKETGMDSGIVKELLAHSNLATTERYMGNFDTQRTDNALINLFGSVGKPKDKKEEILGMLKDLSPEDVASILHEINK